MVSKGVQLILVLVLVWTCFTFIGFAHDFLGLWVGCSTAPLALSYCKVKLAEMWGSDPQYYRAVADCEKAIGATELRVNTWLPVSVVTPAHSLDWYCDVPTGQWHIGNVLLAFLGYISGIFIGILIAVLLWTRPSEKRLEMKHEKNTAAEAPKIQMKCCRYCGAHIPSVSMFCGECGKRLG
jgi:hypothetical protein